MANLSITIDCNRECSYCFARLVNVSERNMSRTTFLRALDFLNRSNIPKVRLLGGEPTLHHDFDWFVDQSLERGFKLFLFSNGLMPESAIAKLESYTHKNVTVIINVNHAETQFVRENQQQIRTYRRLNQRVMLGFNIHTATPNLDFLIGLIEKYKLCRSVRLGLAHPCLDGSNKYLHPKDYLKVGQRIYEFFKRAVKKGIQVDFDCGFVPCMFPSDFFKISNVSFEKISRCCGPIPDILPDGIVIYCYPLASAIRLSFNNESDALSLKKKLEKQMQLYRPIGIFRECFSCSLKKTKLCVGGCLSAAMQRIRSNSKNIDISQVEMESIFKEKNSSRISITDTAENNDNEKNTDYSSIKRYVIPYIDQSLDFWKQIYDEFGDFVKAVYFPLRGDLIGSGRPPQPKKYLENFLSLSLFSYSVLINPITLVRPVNEIAESIINSLKKFQKKHNLLEVTTTNLKLAKYIKENIPSIHIIASTLMDLSKPNQIFMLGNIFDVIIPASRIMRDLNSIKELRKAFQGRIRLIVNEACLPGCPFRVQHFHEMADSHLSNPPSLCNDILKQMPWMRLTGAWVLPQHLHLYTGLFDEVKLAGRVTLNNPTTYRRVLNAYIHNKKLSPNGIGGGPASVLEPINIDEKFYAKTLYCNHHCHSCNICKNYYERALIQLDNPKI